MGKKRTSVETGTSLSPSGSDVSPFKRRRVGEPGYVSDDEIAVEKEQANGLAPGTDMVQNAGQELFMDDEVDLSSVTNEGDSEDEESEEDEEGYQKEVELARSRGFAETGVLERITVYNFMCHECFEIPLGPNVNIINGRNGSGKSALVAALQVGLGARSKVTERGQKLEDHIKHGKSFARICIKIKNRPLAENSTTVDPYRPELYGSSITIERKLCRGGGGSWSIKTEKGKNVKLPKGRTVRQEVTNIVDYFGFQVNNPIAILTQTKSKEFLQSGKASDQYRFFMASTRLAELGETIEAIKRMTKEVSKIVEQKEAVQPEVAKQVEELKSAYEDASEMRTINERIEQIELEYAWTVADEKETLLEQYKEKTMEFENIAGAAKLARDTLKQEVEGLDAAFFEAQKELEDITSKVRANQSVQRNLNKQQQNAEYELQQKLKKVQRMENEIARYLRNREEANQRLERAREDHNRRAASRSKIARDHQETRQELEGAKAAITEAGEVEKKWNDDLRHVQQEKQELEKRVTYADSNYREANRDLEHIKHSQKNSVARWGRDMPTILNAIQNAVRTGQVKVRPIGPIGEHVSLIDKFWGRAVQACISFGLLQSFLVDSAHDSDVLKRLFKEMQKRGQIHCMPGLIVTNFRRSRYSRLQIPDVHKDGHRTILDVVKIDTDPVFNILLDFAKIERNVLLRDERLMTTYPYQQIRNMDCCWDPTGARGYSRSGSRVYRPNDRPRDAVALTASVEELIAAKTHQTLQLRGALDSARQKIQEHTHRLMQVQGNHNAARSRLSALQTKVRALEAKSRDLHEQLSSSHEEFDASNFEEEMQAISHQAQQAESTKVALEASVVEVRKRCDDATRAAENHSTNSRALRAKNQQKLNEVEQLNSDMGRLKAALQNKEREAQKTQSKVDGAHRELGMAKNEHRNAVREAGELGGRPQSMQGLDSETLEREIKAMKQRVEEERERHDGKSADELEIEWRRAQIREKDNKEALKRIKGYSTALKKGHTRRENDKNALFKSTKMLVRLHFQTFLRSRGHQGVLKWKQSGLLITVKMANHKMYGTNQLYETKDMRSLSGGERSYTTLSFMLALGNVMDVPTRVMGTKFALYLSSLTLNTAH